MAPLMDIPVGDPLYPPQVERALGSYRPDHISALGNADLLSSSKVALLCSRRCPGDLASQTYDVAQTLRDNGIPVAGGFHAPMEKECLKVLLASPYPVVVALARSLNGNTRLPSEFRRPLDEGRLVVVSCFTPGINRVTRETAARRNLFVAALADKVFVAHAEEGGSALSLCRTVLSWKRPLYTLAAPRNQAAIDIGAQPLRSDETRLHLV